MFVDVMTSPSISLSVLSFCLAAGFQTPWFYCRSGCLSTVAYMLHRSSLIRQLDPERYQFYILLVYVFWMLHTYILSKTVVVGWDGFNFFNAGIGFC